MHVMSGKKLSEHFKLPARTAPEIAREFGRLLIDLQAERKILYKGRKLSGEAMIGGIVLDFLAKSAEEQRKILERRVAEFDRLMGEDDPATSPARPNHEYIAVRRLTPGAEGEPPKRKPSVPPHGKDKGADPDPLPGRIKRRR